MKKFVLVDHWGHWEYKGGKTIIDCTVRGYDKLAESNDRHDLHETINIEYRDNGTWHFTRVLKRAEVKRMGLV